MRNRFLEEARILRHLDSDRIVRVHHIGVLPDDRPYFVMSWADRRTLHDRLRQLRQQGTYLDVETAVLYAGEIATSLQVVHDFGIVHRDVKPSNVLFRSLAPHQRKEGAALGDEALMLGDFGLAKVLTGEMGVTLAAGTPAYMAPEQAGVVCELGPAADIFAATAVTFELLTGQAPFRTGRSPMWPMAGGSAARRGSALCGRGSRPGAGVITVAWMPTLGRGSPRPMTSRSP